jgi:hypothetical protein
MNCKTNLGFVDLQGLTQSLSVNLYFGKTGKNGYNWLVLLKIYLFEKVYLQSLTVGLLHAAVVKL